MACRRGLNAIDALMATVIEEHGKASAAHAHHPLISPPPHFISRTPASSAAPS